ncbi:MAG: GNAT family N-acetyltransferase [Candidatus Eremiobacteraeota bacterium]|nr:GNAT family N-acetyltransferase [Candidatus Eremiobacteraeota bacterium]
MASIRPLTELDIQEITEIDEKIQGEYRPQVWETKILYYIRRDPDASQVAEVDGKVVGFMLGEIRSGEFGLEKPVGWIEVLGIDPAHRGQSLGRQMAEKMLTHFTDQGATLVKTLVPEGMESIGDFFRKIGFERSTIQPLEKRIKE